MNPAVNRLKYLQRSQERREELLRRFAAEAEEIERSSCGFGGDYEEKKLGPTLPPTTTLFIKADRKTIESLPLRPCDGDDILWNPLRKEFTCPELYRLLEVCGWQPPGSKGARELMLYYIMTHVVLASDEEGRLNPAEPSKDRRVCVLKTEELAGVIDHLIWRRVGELTSPRLVVMHGHMRWIDTDHYKILAALYAVMKEHQCFRPLFGALTNGLVWQFYHLDNQFTRSDEGDVLLWRRSKKYYWEDQSEEILCILAGIFYADLHQE